MKAHEGRHFFSSSLLTVLTTWVGMLLVAGSLLTYYWPLPIGLVLMLAFLPQIPLLGMGLAQRSMILDLEMMQEQHATQQEVQQIEQIAQQIHHLSQQDQVLASSMNELALLLRTSSLVDGDQTHETQSS